MASPTATANRRDFRRTEISSTEKSIGGLIILVLIAVGLFIYFQGQSYDVSKYTGNVEALESTRTAVEGKAATLRNETDLRSYEMAGSASPESPATAAKAIPALIPALVAIGPTEHYTEDTLFEKINGRAPAYFEYNFVELSSRSFSITDMSAEFIDVYLFTMDSPLNAYGIFSAERDATGTPVDFIADGYRSEMGYFFRQGSTYGQILASSTLPSVMETAGNYTRELVATLQADNSGLEGRALLPVEGQLPGSLTYINENAYGQAVLNGVFEAKYEVDGTELALFAQAAPDAEAARSNWEALQDFYSRYGTIAETFEEGGAQGFVADMFGEWSIVYTREAAVVGVMNASDREAAMQLIQTQLGSSAEDTDPYADFSY